MPPYVGVSPTAPGLSIFAGLSGRRLRQLTADPNDSAPMVADRGREVYFLRPTPGPSCLWRVLEVPVGGGTPKVVVGSQAIQTFAVSASGTMLAYITAPGGCSPRPPFTLHVVDTTTHLVSSVVVPLDVESMAWSPVGDRLLLVGPATSPAVASIIYAVSDPGRLSQVSLAAIDHPPPCPEHASRCTQAAPAFGADGALFYVALLGPDHYVLTRVQATGSVGLASVMAPAGGATFLAVAPASNAAVFTVGAVSYLWRQGHRLAEVPTVRGESW